MGEVPPPVPSPLAPGLAWLEILQRPVLEAFASAFTQDAVLDASVLREPARGAAAIRKVFDAPRGMCEQIAFLHETRSDSRTYFEWEGRLKGHNVAGVTVLVHDARGLIEGVRLHHRPYDQVVAFSTELACRLAEVARG